jgi:hypothetical protein
MRNWKWCVGVVWLAVTGITTASADVPPLAKLKAAAEEGNSEAQYEFALKFGAGTAEWKQWLERSAAQGNGRAEDELAWALNWQNFAVNFPDERMRSSHLKTNSAAMRRALIYASSAADKGFPRSRMILGMAFANGYLVSRDQAEAYKWLKLSGSGGMFADVAVASPRDRLLKEMPLAAVQEGEKRANEYRPGTTPELIRTQLVLPLLKLTGLATMNGKRVALISGKKLIENQDTSIDVGGVSVVVRAISITEKEAVICLPPVAQRYVLRP